MRKKKGFLLLEVIIVLFVISVIAIPWYSFIMAIQSREGMDRLNNYFLTKEIFVRAYNDEISGGEYSFKDKFFIIIKGNDEMIVQMIDGEYIQEEIKVKLR